LGAARKETTMTDASALLLIPPPLLAVPDRAVWLDVLDHWSELGVLEQPGPNHDHPLIVELLRRVHVPAGMLHDETAWCSAGMNGAMDASGLRGTGSAAARSWEHWGVRLQEPRIGCVAVLWRGAPSSGTGHVAAWLGDIGHQMVLRGCNQNNRACLALYPRDRLLSYRWPDESCLVRP
jgi:uncharacterized protein (TIGR02594 family)